MFFCIPNTNNNNNMSEFINKKNNKKKVTFNMNRNECYTIYHTIDNLPPNQDDTNVLFGLKALIKAKEINIGKGWQQTFDLVTREFYLPLEKNGCNGNWEIFEKKISIIDEPDYHLFGLLWRQLYGNSKRLEE